MKELGAVLIVAAILIVVLGMQRGWFDFSSPAPAASNQVHINLATDTDKLKQDANMVMESATEPTGGISDDVQAEGRSNDTGNSDGL